MLRCAPAKEHRQQCQAKPWLRAAHLTPNNPDETTAMRHHRADPLLAAACVSTSAHTHAKTTTSAVPDDADLGDAAPVTYSR